VTAGSGPGRCRGPRFITVPDVFFEPGLPARVNKMPPGRQPRSRLRRPACLRPQSCRRRAVGIIKGRSRTRPPLVSWGKGLGVIAPDARRWRCRGAIRPAAAVRPIPTRIGRARLVAMLTATQPPLCCDANLRPNTSAAAVTETLASMNPRLCTMACQLKLAGTDRAYPAGSRTTDPP
jgi:hypothetical protein